MPTELKSQCLFSSRSGKIIPSAVSSSLTSPEPWQAETETMIGEETPREALFFRYWTSVMNTCHPLSSAALYLLSPETTLISLVSRCAYQFSNLNIKSEIGMLALQDDSPNFKEPRFYLFNPLLSHRLYLDLLAILGVRRLHQRSHLARLSWRYLGCIRTMVIAQCMTLAVGSRNWFYQNTLNPHQPPFSLKLRSAASLSMSYRSHPLCGILDHHLHGREDPPGLSRYYIYSLHLLVTSLVSSAVHITRHSTSRSKLRTVLHRLVYHRLHTLCGILDHHFHGREDPPCMTWLYTCCSRFLVLAPMVNPTAPKLLKYHGNSVLIARYRGYDYGLRVFYTNSHSSTFPAKCFKYRCFKQTNSTTFTTIGAFVPQTLAMAVTWLVVLTPASLLTLPLFSTAQCLQTVTNLSPIESIDDVHSRNLDSACFQLPYSTCLIAIMDSCLMFSLTLFMFLALGKAFACYLLNIGILYPSLCNVSV